MSFIHLYLDKNNNSNDELINLLKNHNIDFLQHNIENNETYINAYNLESLPAIKFKDSIIHDINENSVKTIVNEFNNFVDNLPTTKSKHTLKTKNNTNEEEISIENKNPSNQILVNTIKISNKERLYSYVKNFSKKHKN